MLFIARVQRSRLALACSSATSPRLLNLGQKHRTMATNTAKKEFLCIMPDRANIRDLRERVKPIHDQCRQPLIATGVIPAGGVIIVKHPEEGEEESFLGSIVVYAANDAQEVRRIIEKDIYAISGVWDMERVQIFPYVPEVRKALAQ